MIASIPYVFKLDLLMQDDLHDFRHITIIAVRSSA
jgi:hypothetical protein